MSMRKWLQASGFGAVQNILRSRKSRRHGVLHRLADQMTERLEDRVLLSVPAVSSLSRSSPLTQITAASTVNYALTFNQSVTGVAAGDFKVITSGPVAAGNTVGVSGSGSSYTVTVNSIHGNGNLQLELVDDDSIQGGGTPLGGPGAGNGSFVGDNYIIAQTGPAVLSINRSNPSGSTASGPSVTFAVTFSSAVTGVDPTDFQVTTSGGVTFSPPVVVSGSGSSYNVTVNGITGTGTLGLNLVDNYSIRDLAGNPLQNNATTSGSFSARQTFGVGSFRANSVIAADMNGDGIPDLVEANTTNSVGILLGNGNGTFQAVQTFATNVPPVSVAVADVNGDGKLDVAVVAGNSTSTVGVLLGNGNGTLQPQHTYSVGTSGGPYSVALADINGDGRTDIVVANHITRNAGVLFGNGDGTFGTANTFNTDGYPQSVAVADLNGDGRPDIIIANPYSSDVSVLLSNGKGTFQPQQTYAAGNQPFSVAVGDVNGDGILDLVAANPISNSPSGPHTFAVLLGNGDGTFQSASLTSTNAISNSASLADVNGDGKLDVLVANTSGLNGGPGSMGLFLGNGNGTFQSEIFLALYSTPTSVTAADVNGDGKPDIVMNDGTPTVDVMLGTGVGSFTGQTYSIVVPQDTINGTSGNDAITLAQDSDHQNIDWTLNGSTSGKVLINDPNGLTINGNAGSDTILLGNSPNGNPLPNVLHLNGTFTITGMAASNPLANTTLEMGRSTVFIDYSLIPDPLAQIQHYLQAGYNGGAWNGTPSSTTGVITSLPAAQNLAQTTGIGYADSADGLILGQTPNTIELKYTLYGDTTLTGTVGFNDFTRMTQHWNQTVGAAWDTGDFDYDGTVNLGDFTLMSRTYNTALGSQAAPGGSAAGGGATASGPRAQPPPSKHHSPVKPNKKRR